jgi:hypothetical protein
MMGTEEPPLRMTLALLDRMCDLARQILYRLSYYRARSEYLQRRNA